MKKRDTPASKNHFQTSRGSWASEAPGSRPAASQPPAYPVSSAGPPRCRCPGAPAAPASAGSPLCGNHALQHVEGRLVCLVGKARGQRALQRGDAASVRGHLPVRGGQGRRRGQGRNCRRQRAAVQLGGSAVTLSSRDWMAAALLPAAAMFTARSVT